MIYSFLQYHESVHIFTKHCENVFNTSKKVFLKMIHWEILATSRFKNTV